MSNNNRFRFSFHLLKGFDMDAPVNRFLLKSLAWSMIILSACGGAYWVISAIAPNGIIQ